MKVTLITKKSAKRNDMESKATVYARVRDGRRLHYALEIPFFIAYQDLSERWNWVRKTVMIFLKSLQKMGIIEIKREYRRVTVHILNLAIAPPNTNSEINEDST